MLEEKSADNFSISIVYDEEEQEEGAKGPLSTKLVRKIGKLDTKRLAENLSDFCKQIGKTFENVTTKVKNYELQSFELSVDITAKGEVRFIGNIGGEIKGGLKLVFTKR